MSEKVLVVAAHPDDEILGVGATVKKHNLAGDRVDCLILGEGLTSRQGQEIDDTKLEALYHNTMEAATIVGYQDVYFSRFPDNRFDSIDLLDLVQEVEKYIHKCRPQTLYTHHHGDLNIDHRRAFAAVMTAARPLADCPVKEIYSFETPSSTEWNFKYGDNTFQPNVFVDVAETIEAKIRAMECYHTEVRDFPHPRSLEALKTIAARWGTVIGSSFAEAFYLLRKVKD
ncbi:MAG: PIG-L deacetylase family protein [Halanaerobium sp.]|nr:PIG-L deacetylase family protein [Halanaerobium sp.]